MEQGVGSRLSLCAGVALPEDVSVAVARLTEHVDRGGCCVQQVTVCEIALARDSAETKISRTSCVPLYHHARDVGSASSSVS